MKKLRYIFLGILMIFGIGNMQVIDALAANNVTITVDASDDNDGLLYAIDSTDPDAFSESGSFNVLSGSTHTIYVKDIAGNITSQTYVVPNTEDDSGEEEEKPVVTTNVEESYSDKERQINIDVDLSNNDSQYSDTSFSAEDGGGTLYEKETQTSDDTGKIFYTVTTKEGEVFYLVIDQNHNEDNVYLLSQVTVSDLQYLADSNGYDFIVSGSGQKSGSLLDALSESSEDKTSSADILTDTETNTSKSSSGQGNMNSTILIMIIVALGGGAYYFLKLRKNKQNAQMDEIDEANDMNAYEIDDEDQDEVRFEESDDLQEVANDVSSKDDFLMNVDTESAFGDEGFDEFDDEQEEF